MFLTNKAREAQVRVSPSKRCVKLHQVDHLEEWQKENPIPYISNDNFRQKDICDSCQGGTLMWTERTLLSWGCDVSMWQVHGSPASGAGIERVFPSAWKQHDDLNKNTMNKTLEITFNPSAGRNQYHIRLVMTKQSSPMVMTHTGNTSRLRWAGSW